MYQDITIIDAEEVFGSCSGCNIPGNPADTFETYLKWPAEIGKGFMSTIIPRPGIILEIGNFRLRKDVAISIEQAQHSVSLIFSIAGCMRRTVDLDEYWNCTQGHCIMGYLKKGQQSIIKPVAGSQACYVHISIDPPVLNSLIDGQDDQIPAGLYNIINGAEEQRFYQASMTPPAVNMTIRQIMSCPYHSSLKRMFFEGKALELISYCLAQSLSCVDTSGKDAQLRPNDIERVLQARDILVRDLENPPSLLVLAKQVGTNKTTLNKGFRQIFGTSAFDYLRVHRLERARQLLDNKKMNVTQAAFSVGYAQHSSFTKAFKKHFGTNPTDHLH